MLQATLGFIFNADLSKVLLLTKNRPAWQKDKINGIGGKTELGESPETCISREVFEETGLTIDAKTWHSVGSIEFDTWQVEIFTTIFLGNEKSIESKTDEVVGWFSVDNLPENVMSNLKWLIPLSIDVLTNKTPPRVSVRY